MTLTRAEVLSKIPQWLNDADVSALQSHEDAADKDVRKAVRKALHQLRTRKVVVAPAQSRGWTFSEQSNGHATSRALVDVRSRPGLIQLFLTDDLGEDGGRLTHLALGFDERVFGCNVYRQTAGQRSRLVRDWENAFEGRTVSPDWVRARMFWARERLIASGQSVPRELDVALADLPPMSADQPSLPPLAGLDQVVDAPELLQEQLVRLGFAFLPPFLPLDDVAVRLAAAVRGEDEIEDQEAGRKRYLELLSAACADDLALRTALRAALANVLEDLCVAAWLEGDFALAQSARAAGSELRKADAPEKLAVATAAVELQILSLRRAYAEHRAQSEQNSQGV